MPDPFRYKLPIVISVPYLFCAIGKPDFARAALLLFMAMLTAIGFAAFGYLTNDWSDVKKDELAGKKNLLSLLGFPTRVFLLVLTLFFALAPWYYLPHTTITVLLFMLEIALFVVYAFPPLRLKERGFAGVFTDALYAHAIPAVFAAYTFSLAITVSPFRNFLISLLFTWQLITGIRNILIHQVEDIENDKAGGNRTFVIRAGIENAKRLIRYACIPLEVMLLAALLFLLTRLMDYSFPVIVGVYWVVLLYFNRNGLRGFDNYKTFVYMVLDDFYLECFPLCLLTYLSIHNYCFLILLAIHVLVFPKNIFRRVVSPFFLQNKAS